MDGCWGRVLYSVGTLMCIYQHVHSSQTGCSLYVFCGCFCLATLLQIHLVVEQQHMHAIVSENFIFYHRSSNQFNLLFYLVWVCHNDAKNQTFLGIDLVG